jgi:hypothetical protein
MNDHDDLADVMILLAAIGVMGAVIAGATMLLDYW